MNESGREELIKAFRDQEYRESYAEDFLNTSLATQMRVLREQRELTQAQLAEEVGTKQTAISRIENVNNTARNIGTLMKVAFKLGCRLKVSFETFGSLVDESLQFSRENLMRPTLEEDPVFAGPSVSTGYHLSAGYPASIGVLNVPNAAILYGAYGTNTQMFGVGSMSGVLAGVTPISYLDYANATVPACVGPFGSSNLGTYIYDPTIKEKQKSQEDAPFKLAA
jgi:transcriptional regulator with XRE-family HTH domain